MNNYKLYVIILAGGIGKRMKSDLPKVLHLIGGIPMIIRIIETVNKLNPTKIIIVVGIHYERIKKVIDQYNFHNIEYAYQENPLGTGNAVKSTLHLLDNNERSINMILNGDCPLITFETLRELYTYFINHKNKLQITCIKLDDPTGNGRIILDKDGNFVRIIEEKDCTEMEKTIKLINCGIYIATTDILLTCIPKIRNLNAQNEYYLTDIVEIYKKVGGNIGLYELSPLKVLEIYNINTKDQLEYINFIMNKEMKNSTV